jgi:hypothetical protein
MLAHSSAVRIALATLAVAAATAVRAADPPSAGGLVPARRLTREELVRKWDINSDGKIDKGEAEVASSRMRRERAELRLNSGIDPVTGRPRGEEPPPANQPSPDLDPLLGTETAPPATEKPDREGPTLPGSRVPRAESPAAKSPRPGGPAAAAAREPASRPSPLRQPITGGVRGGGVAARPGYGVRGPATPLNAGRPIDSLRDPSGGARGLPQTSARGGLVPQPRQPVPRPTRETFDPY